MPAMRRPVALAATALLLLSGLLAGCASRPHADGGATAAPSATYTVIAGGNRAPAATTTDDLHLLERPRVTTHAPTGADPVRVRINSFFQDSLSVSGFRDTWNYTLPKDVHGLVGNATLLVEVTGTLVGDPRADLQGGGCFWNLSVGVGSYETGNAYSLGCVKEGTQVPAGLYTLTIPFTLSDLSIPAGTALRFELYSGEDGPRSPNADAELLTGAAGQDSVVRIFGLQVPIDPSLLVQAT